VWLTGHHWDYTVILELDRGLTHAVADVVFNDFFLMHIAGGTTSDCGFNFRQELGAWQLVFRFTNAPKIWTTVPLPSSKYSLAMAIFFEQEENKEKELIRKISDTIADYMLNIYSSHS
jgi:hypothetical protein